MLCALSFTAVAQEKGDGKTQQQLNLKEGVNQTDLFPANKECNSVFRNVQEGLRAGNINLFSRHLGSQVYVNLRGGESGYYSDNQVHYVLRNYLRAKKLSSFEFTTAGESESNPYATGSAVFIVKGTREIAQVYVSLSYVGERWVITQINIY
jgi:hypothetical protein